MTVRSAGTCSLIFKYTYTYIVFIYWTNQFKEKNKKYMVTYFCHHMSDNYVALSDVYVDLSVIYVDLSDHYVDLLEKYHH